jgi:hypothetical protein
MERAASRVGGAGRPVWPRARRQAAAAQHFAVGTKKGDIEGKRHVRHPETRSGRLGLRIAEQHSGIGGQGCATHQALLVLGGGIGKFDVQAPWRLRVGRHNADSHRSEGHLCRGTDGRPVAEGKRQ